MDTSLKTIVLLTILTANAWSSITSNQQAQPSQSQLSPKETEQVVLNVTVTDKAGGFVAGLKSSDFEVSIDKKPAHIASLRNEDSPVSIGIVLDSSGSMIEGSDTRDYYVLREALRLFLFSSNQSNDYFLMGFNIKPQLLADWTSDRLTIIDKFKGLQVYGNTAVYDACYLAVDKLQGGPHAKRALVLISDGQDNSSHYTFNELRELLRETDILLYSLALPSKANQGSSLAMEYISNLEELSSLSGGRVFSFKEGAQLRPKDANISFEKIATELRNQYTLSIIPNESLASKKWHKIRVKVNLQPDASRQRRDLDVRTREGVYAH